MTEPTKEELMARIAELEKQVGTKKSGRLEFRPPLQQSAQVARNRGFTVVIQCRLLN